MQIYTERSVLVPVEEKHVPYIYKYFDNQVTRYMIPSAAKSKEETQAVVARFIRQRQDGTDFVFAITLKESGAFLGLAGLHHLKDEAPELGIWTKTEAHGHHYGREAIGGLITYARWQGIARLRYPVDRCNIPSRKIPLYYGGRLTISCTQVTTPDGRVLEQEVYEITL